MVCDGGGWCVLRHHQPFFVEQREMPESRLEPGISSFVFLYDCI